jgi:NADH:ubiquinone oxidoreductase subunit 5 (subunit L)/multisubunit Na+/H+ antiporter MnhA subunit
MMKPLYHVLGEAGALTTAYCEFRLYALSFQGVFRCSEKQAAHLPESLAAMTVPLIILAVFSVAGGWVGIPAVLAANAQWLKDFLSPVLDSGPGSQSETGHHISHSTELMLMALFVLNITGKQGLLPYSAAYSQATIGIFAILNRVTDFTYQGFNGLDGHEPLVAGMLIVFLLSFRCIPLSAGFFAKYHMILAVLRQYGKTWLAIVAVFCAAVGVFYCFKVIQAMYFKEGPDPDLRLSKPYMGALLAAALLIFALGVHPDRLLSFMNLRR